MSKENKNLPAPWLAIEDAYAAGKQKLATEKTFRAAKEINKTNEHYKRIAIALAYTQFGDAPENIQTAFGEAIEAAPAKSAPHRFMGLFHARMGDVFHAYEEFEKARQLDSNNPRALFYLSELFYMNTQYEDAGIYADEALSKCQECDAALTGRIYAHKISIDLEINKS
jgi:tetratricopeptide (TPR) repeat protein